MQCRCIKNCAEWCSNPCKYTYNKPPKTDTEREPFKNTYGTIEVGTRVRFEVENQDMWGGDLEGVLAYDETSKRYVIDTPRSGRLKLEGYLSVYWNTVRPIQPYEVSPWEKLRTNITVAIDEAVRKGGYSAAKEAEEHIFADIKEYLDNKVRKFQFQYVLTPEEITHSGGPELLSEMKDAYEKRLFRDIGDAIRTEKMFTQGFPEAPMKDGLCKRVTVPVLDPTK